MSNARESVHIRTAQNRDLPQILQIYSQPGVDDGVMLSLAEAEQIFQRMESYPNYHLYVAELDGVVVGTFALLIMDNLGHLGAPSGVVEDVAVEPSFQGRGIGKMMMEYAMERCREARCYKMALSANLQRVAAHQFYENLGFQRHGYSFVVELGTIC